MSTQNKFAVTKIDAAMPELLEALLSALAGCSLVLMLAFFLSLESWVVSAMGLG